MTKTIITRTYWKCDGCGTIEESTLRPTRWWSVSIANFEGHLCPNCSPAVQQYIEDYRRAMGDDT